MDALPFPSPVNNYNDNDFDLFMVLESEKFPKSPQTVKILAQKGLINFETLPVARESFEMNHQDFWQ